MANLSGTKSLILYEFCIESPIPNRHNGVSQVLYSSARWARRLKMVTRRTTSLAITLASALMLSASAARADIVGSIFLTGHDPDFHAVSGNTVGAQHIIQDAVGFIMDPAFNTFVAGGNQHFLFVQCDTCGVPGGHIDGRSGINASAPGFAALTSYETHGATDGLATELGLLGTKYSALVIGSDFGGLLTQAELDLLNADSAGIISFLNSGGGLFAMSETTPGIGGLASSGFFGYLPFIVSTNPVSESEVGNTLTPLGTSLGLVNSDINGNFSHNVFTSTGGLGIVDTDPGNEILSLAGRGKVGVTGLVPEPSSFIPLAVGIVGLVLARRRAASRKQAASL